MVREADKKSLVEHLQREVFLGKAAAHAYNNYLKDCFIRKLDAIYKEFIQVPPSDVETLVKMRYSLIALQTFENDVLLEIETGKFAAEQLKTLSN